MAAGRQERDESAADETARPGDRELHGSSVAGRRRGPRRRRPQPRCYRSATRGRPAPGWAQGACSVVVDDQRAEAAIEAHHRHRHAQRRPGLLDRHLGRLEQGLREGRGRGLGLQLAVGGQRDAPVLADQHDRLDAALAHVLAEVVVDLPEVAAQQLRPHAPGERPRREPQQLAGLAGQRLRLRGCRLGALGLEPRLEPADRDRPPDVQAEREEHQRCHRAARGVQQQRPPGIGWLQRRCLRGLARLSAGAGRRVRCDPGSFCVLRVRGADHVLVAHGHLLPSGVADCSRGGDAVHGEAGPPRRAALRDPPRALVAQCPVAAPVAIPGEKTPHAPVHLHHEGPAQGHPAGQGDPEGHLAVVLPRRQDRRARRERRRQVDAAAHHGRRRQGLRRRGVPGRGHAHRLPAAGAAARPDEERAASTSRRRSPRSGRSSSATRRSRRTTRTTPPTSSRGSRTRSTPRTCGSSTSRSRSRWTRCACRRATPTSRRSRAASSAASRCAGCCSQPADMLLLDEPTNHLDAESVAWLERFLKEYPGTVVAVTHDRYFLDNVAGWILELDRGAGIPWEGNYSSWLEQKDQRLTQEEKEASARQRTLERELEWVRMAPRARQAKSKARLTRYEEMLAEEQAAEKRDDKREISIPPGPAARRRRDRGEGPAQGLRRQPADRRPRLHAAARRHRRRHRPERRRQDDAVPHDRRPGEARRRRAEGRRDGRARRTSTRAATP